MSTRAKILKIVGCYWGRDWDATGTLLGRYWDATVQVHRVRLEGPTTPMTAEILQVGTDVRRHRPIIPDHPTVSHRCPPVTPLLSMLTQNLSMDLRNKFPSGAPLLGIQSSAASQH